MLTNFGKALRKIRIEHEVTLGDLGELLSCSASFISALETGKKAVPPNFLNDIAAKLRLTMDEQIQLTQAAALQVKEVSLGLNNRSDKAKELAVAFARRFETMSEEEIAKALSSLNSTP